MLHNWSILLADDWQHAACVCNWACDARYSACKHPFSADMLIFQKPLTSVMQAVFGMRSSACVFGCAVRCVNITGRATLMNLGSLDISSSSLASAEQVVYKYTNTLLRTHPSLLTHAAGPAPFIVQFRCPPSFVCLPLPLLEWNMHVLVAFLHTLDEWQHIYNIHRYIH